MRTSYHKGWRVLGYSPEQLRTAKAEHEAARSKSPDMKPWDPVSFMQTNKPIAVRHQPYVVYDAATQCLQLAERAGWQNCRVVPVAKGVA